MKEGLLKGFPQGRGTDEARCGVVRCSAEVWGAANGEGGHNCVLWQPVAVLSARQPGRTTSGTCEREQTGAPVSPDTSR